MCGICGIYFLDRERAVDEPLLTRMAHSMRHRGPDDEGVFFISFAEGSVGLGHCRLAILDLSRAGRQPMCDPAKRFWITYNGEVYNYKEIREALVRDNFQFRTKTDTEVILAAYIRYGKDCLKKFNGMFSFAICDSEKKNLFCARDRLGVKPFF